MEIGRGTYAIVYKKHDYVIKKFIPRFSSYAFINELAMLCYLQHKNIINVLDFKVDQIILPYGKCTLIDKIFKEWPSRENLKEEKYQIMQNLMEGVEYLHSKNIIHTDLKPDNIIFMNNDELKIIDFNSALFKKKQIINYDQELTTIWYRAPELIIKQDFTEAIDLWSCGIILYMIFTENFLFTERNSKVLLDKIRNFHKFTDQYLSHAKCRGLNFHEFNEIEQIIKILLHGNPDHRQTYKPFLQSLIIPISPISPISSNSLSLPSTPLIPRAEKINPDDLFSIYDYCCRHKYGHDIYFLSIYIYKLYIHDSEGTSKEEKNTIKYCCIHLAINFLYLYNDEFMIEYNDIRKDIIMKTKCDFLVKTYFDYVRIFEEPVRKIVFCLLICISFYPLIDINDKLIVCYCELLVLYCLKLINFQNDQFRSIIKKFYQNYLAPKERNNIFRAVFIINKYDFQKFKELCENL